MAFKKKAPRKSITSSDYGPKQVRGRYDSASTSNENANLWANVDGLSAAQANSPAVRKVIRDRARYETANNSYGAGIVKTLSNDVIGPTIKLQLGNSDLQQKTEIAFQKWAKATKLFSKLRTMRRAKAVDGESFAMLRTNPKVRNPVKLDLLPIECDMIEGYFTNISNNNEIDGIKFDKYQNPMAYRLLKSHPGDYRWNNYGKTGGTWIDAKYMLHYFDCDRPGQVRGVSEIVSPLQLFGQLRAFTAAVLENARRSAEITGILKTTLLPDGDGAPSLEAGFVMEAVRNSVMAIPEGYEYQGMKAEQPTNTYKEFKDALINEAARCLNMPANVAMGNSAGYNYASGRLDHQTYDKSIDVDRQGLEEDVTIDTYFAWLDEHAALEGYTPMQIDELSNPIYYYVGRGHVDPAKEANADDTRIKNKTLTLSKYYSSQGEDWKVQQTQGISEMISAEVEWNEARAKAGLDPAPYPMYGEVVTEPAQPESNNEVNDNE